MANNTIKLLRDNIKKYRKQKKYSQVKLGLITDISSDYLSEIERGKSTPSLKTIIAIAKGLEIEVKDLFEFE